MVVSGSKVECDRSGHTNVISINLVLTKKEYQTHPISIIQPWRCILEFMFELLLKAFFARDIHDDDM